MKKIKLIASIILSGCCFIASAEGLDNVVIASGNWKNSATSSGKESYYIKSFDVTVGNFGKDINLKKICFKAYDAKGNEFNNEIIDGKLADGILKKDKHIKGMVGFSSKDESVYAASMVKITDQCNKK